MRKINFLYPITLICLSVCLSGCNLSPAFGPNPKDIVNLSEPKSARLPDVDVIDINDSVVNDLFNQRTQSFTQFTYKKSNYSGVVNIGDTLDVLIWEAAPAVLFGNVITANTSGSSNLTKLPEQTVNKEGNITIPFLGSVHVKGKTIEQIQVHISQRLSKIANQAQALVRLNKNNTESIAVFRQGNGIRMPLTSQEERILDAIAAVGGVQESLEAASVQLTRGNEVKILALEKIISNPSENIPLRSGDIVTLFNTPFSFTGLGALGTNKTVKFSANGMTLAEGIAQMGGLIDIRSDPQSIFIFRHIPFENLDSDNQEKWKARGYSMGMDIPTVYRISLLEPKSLFWLQKIPVKNKDVLYVANSPLVEFHKFLSLIFSITSPINQSIKSF